MHAGGVVTGAASSASQSLGSGRWGMIALLFFAVLINYIDRGNLSIAAVPLMHDFGVSPGRMGRSSRRFSGHTLFCKFPPDTWLTASA